VKTSPSGAPVLNGKGLQSVGEKIRQEFLKVRHVEATSVAPSAPVVPPAQSAIPIQPETPAAQPAVAAKLLAPQHNERRFLIMSKALAASAVRSPYISKSTTQRQGAICHEISIPQESADELVKMAMERLGK
jgi:hypothetical protein